MIIVMSDSHGERRVIEEIKREYPKAAAFFHCGDSELEAADEVWQGIQVVAGNCDYDLAYKNYKVVQADGQKILVTHGHLYGLNAYELGNLPYVAAEVEADIVLFGHIHRPVAEIIDGRLFLNPGSVAQPRGEWREKMYAQIEIEEDRVHKTFKISYKDLQHRPIPQLQLRLETLK